VILLAQHIRLLATPVGDPRPEDFVLGGSRLPELAEG